MNTNASEFRLPLGRVLVTRRLKNACVPSDILPCLYLHSSGGGGLKTLETRSAPLLHPFVATYETRAGAGISISTDAEQGTTLVSISAEVDPSPAGDLEAWILASTCPSCGEPGRI